MLKPKNDVALKENFLSLKLLGEGKTVTVLREIDPRDSTRAGNEFNKEFFLFPDSSAVDEQRVKETLHGDFEESLADSRASMGMLKFRNYASIRAVARLTGDEALRAIQDEHPWTQAAAAERFAKHPDGLYLWVLRVYRMASPLMLVARPMYDGAHHWVKLEAPLSTRGATPVLPREIFERRVHAIRAKLGLA